MKEIIQKPKSYYLNRQMNPAMLQVGISERGSYSAPVLGQTGVQSRSACCFRSAVGEEEMMRAAEANLW